jgi:hypothetical protein
VTNWNAANAARLEQASIDTVTRRARLVRSIVELREYLGRAPLAECARALIVRALVELEPAERQDVLQKALTDLGQPIVRFPGEPPGA